MVVDDGLATGYTARAAVAAARARGAAAVVLAVPVAAPETVAEFASLVDRVVCVEMPDFLFAVGASYADFSQTGDDEVERLLAESGAGRPVAVRGGGGWGRASPSRGTLTVPPGARGVVLFAHGSGSSRHSPRNRAVAAALQEAGLATLLFDLLTPGEEADRSLVFDIPLLGGRLAAATAWLRRSPAGAAGLPVGYFGASTGAGAALWAAAGDPAVAAVVSRGGRPDLAGPRLGEVAAPTLLIVGSRDPVVLDLNREAQAALRAECRLEVVAGATHLFEEPGATGASGPAGPGLVPALDARRGVACADPIDWPRPPAPQGGTPCRPTSASTSSAAASSPASPTARSPMCWRRPSSGASPPASRSSSRATRAAAASISIVEGRTEVRAGDTVLAHFGSGDYFGEMALLLPDTPRTADVIALEDTTCLVITQWDLRALLSAHPETGLAIMGELARRLADTDRTLRE